LTGRSSISGEEVNRFWAALGLVPVAGGVIRRVGEPMVDALAQLGKVDAAKVANSGERLLWGPWKDYQKVTIEGREYAQIGDRLYTEHAVNRVQPSGSRYSGGSGELGSGQVYSGRDAGRSISPNLVDDVIRNGIQNTVTMPNGVTRTVHTSGTVQVVTELNGKLVVTVNPFSGGK